MVTQLPVHLPQKAKEDDRSNWGYVTLSETRMECLASAWPTSGNCCHWGVSQWMEKPSLPLTHHMFLWNLLVSFLKRWYTKWTAISFLLATIYKKIKIPRLLKWKFYQSISHFFLRSYFRVSTQWITNMNTEIKAMNFASSTYLKSPGVKNSNKNHSE